MGVCLLICSLVRLGGAKGAITLIRSFPLQPHFIKAHHPSNLIASFYDPMTPSHAVKTIQCLVKVHSTGFRDENETILHCFHVNIFRKSESFVRVVNAV